MARSVAIYALVAEEEAEPAFYPTLRLAQQAFQWLVDDGAEPTIHTVNVRLNRQGICDVLNDWRAA